MSEWGAWAWFQDREQRNQTIPRLYYDGPNSLLCARRWAFRVSSLFTSEYQARLWCEYHGFEFVRATVLALPRMVCFNLPPKAVRFRLRVWNDFHVEMYESHRAVCPDCMRRAKRVWTPSVGEQLS